MRLFSRASDGGPRSPVEALFLFESKRFGSIALLKFNEGARAAYHTHAFNALTWFIKGDLTEYRFEGGNHQYTRSILPKVTRRSCNHRVVAWRDSWCFTIRGPWQRTWTEDEAGKTTLFGWGRVVLSKDAQ